ncbi:MAG: preprotein translocase subunit YajC [Planctomycetota bacterium]|jgi:preprotein translocase subunit YajC
MTAFLRTALVLAYEAGGAAAGGEAAGRGAAAQQTPFAGLWGLLPFVIILIGFFWFTSRGQKKRERQRQEMLDNIGPKDDVMTIGGLYGRVVRIKDDEVVLRIDPEKDIKVTLAKSGISRKVTEEEPA